MKSGQVDNDILPFQTLVGIPNIDRVSNYRPSSNEGVVLMLADAIGETLPLVFDNIDRSQGEVVQFGRAQGSTVIESNVIEGQQNVPFAEYYESELVNVNEQLSGVGDDHSLSPGDEPLLRTRQFLERGRTFGPQGDQIRCRVDLDAVQRPIGFREYPLVVLLYAFASVSTPVETVYEIDVGQRPMPDEKNDAISFVCRYQHGNGPDDEGVERLDGAHAQLVRNGLRCLSAELSNIHGPLVVNVTGYRASRPVTGTYHRLQPERDWDSAGIEAVWDSAFSAARIEV